MSNKNNFTKRKCLRKSSKTLFKWKRKELLSAITRVKDYLRQTNSKKEDYVTSKCKTKMYANYRVKTEEVEPFSIVCIARELRKCLISHDWSGAAKLVVLLIDGPKFLTPLIWRSCIIILKNHPSSSKELLNEFVLKSTGSSALLEQIFSFKECKPPSRAKRPK